ncbi:unnamed protein product [Cochlearia groenlandica]
MMFTTIHECGDSQMAVFIAVHGIVHKENDLRGRSRPFTNVTIHEWRRSRRKRFTEKTFHDGVHGHSRITAFTLNSNLSTI